MRPVNFYNLTTTGVLIAQKLVMKPNIVIIVADDHAYQYISDYGNSSVKTLAIDTSLSDSDQGNCHNYCAGANGGSFWTLLILNFLINTKISKLMKHMLLMLLSFSTLCVLGQSTIGINLQNTYDIKILKKTFFKGPENFVLSKVDDANYILKYNAARPEIIFLNNRQILVTPGDSLQVIFRVLDSSSEAYEDIIIAKGKNAANYMFSNFNRAKELDKYYPKDEEKYDNVKSYCSKILQYKFINEKYIDSVFKKIDATNELIGYKKRERQYVILYNLINYEKYILGNRPEKTKIVTETIDSLFLNMKFDPIDSTFTSLSQYTIKEFLARTVSLKFNDLQTQKDIEECIKYISKYDNSFIKNHFYYFLLKGYKNEFLKNYKEDVVSVLKLISDENLLHDIEKSNFIKKSD